MKLGRMGHSAQYAKQDNAIYIFGGQQDREGGQAGTVRDFQNDVMKLDLGTGKYEKLMMSHMAGIARRVYTTSLMIS